MLLDKGMALVLTPNEIALSACCASNEQVQQRSVGASMCFRSLRQGSSCQYIQVGDLSSGPLSVPKPFSLATMFFPLFVEAIR